LSKSTKHNTQFKESIMENYFYHGIGILLEGFSDEEGTGTKPGFSVKNDSFSVRFESIQIKELTNVPVEFTADTIDDFESSYDWAPVMEMILECLEEYHDKGAFQIQGQYLLFLVSCEVSFKAWLGEFGGFGLLFALQHSSTQEILIDLFMENIFENPDKSRSELFEDLIELYENDPQGQHLPDLVGKVAAKFQTTTFDFGRRKMLTLKFHGSDYSLIANFSVEKMRLRRTLAEHAAEVVARIVDDVEELEIPETLKEVVGEKIRDHEWVAL